MSTNSTISVLTKDKKIKTIYCHWDGYPENMLEILKEYSSQEKAEEIISLGDLSYLDYSLECPEGHSFDNKIEGYTLSYGRDRGEKDTEAREYKDLTSAMKIEEQEYNYYWNGEGWGLV